MERSSLDLLAGGVAGFGIGLALAFLAFLAWRATAVRRIRQDAIRRSQAVLAGQVHEQLVPHLPGFEFNPRDARFLGSPVDFVVFDGLAAGEVTRVVFLEIKTGRSRLSRREQQVREAVRSRRVEWRELRLEPGTNEAGPP
ncbi:MAG: Holliday junction resolvase-like protein [Gemmatimonadales bacterium]